MKREALQDKLAETLLAIKVDTLVTLLSEIRAKALMKTLAASLTDVEIETLGETVPQKIRRGGYGQISYFLRWVDLETVYGTVAQLKAQALVDTGRQTSTTRDRRKCQHTSKFEGLRFSRHTSRQSSRGRGADSLLGTSADESARLSSHSLTSK